MHKPKKNPTWIILAFLLSILSFSEAGQENAVAQEQTANKAAKVRIIKTNFEKELASTKVPAGKAYYLLETEWENIHPKQKVEKSKLEKKPDRTMGAGELLGGKTKKKEEEYVEADVAYLVPNFFDHAYLLVDGQTYALDKLTEKISGGIGLKSGFSLPKQGDRKKVQFVYLIPEDAKNIAFQFFDYSYGHILIPIQGKLKLAAGSGGIKGKALDQIKDNFLEMAANSVDFHGEYKGNQAPEGWRYAVAEISGKSLSGSASVKDIVQIKPEEYIWLLTKEGYLYYSCGGSMTEEGFIRFTPEFYQNQEVAFLIPATEKEFVLGLRVQNRVYSLRLGTGATVSMPKSLETHQDGRTMEVMLFGVREENERTILNLGIKSLVTSGLEIQADQQFMIIAGEEKIYFDESATQALFHRPPTPFLIPPQTFIRFELAYKAEKLPSLFYFRGYESEKYFDLNKIK